MKEEYLDKKEKHECTYEGCTSDAEVVYIYGTRYYLCEFHKQVRFLDLEFDPRIREWYYSNRNRTWE